MDNTSVARPIVYGSMAFWLGKQANEFHSHRWTIYVRGLQCEDLSYMISKVIFSLHPDFAEPERTITKPPFEVTETGWGEFNVGMRIIFTDPTLPHMDIIHPLKLYPPSNAPLSAKKPVVHEYYDEIVFNDPSVSFYQTLMQGPTVEVPRHPLTDHFGTFDELEDLKRLMAAQAYVKQELEHCRQHLTNADGTLKDKVEMLPSAVSGKGSKKKRKSQAAAAAAAAAAAQLATHGYTLQRD